MWLIAIPFITSAQLNIEEGVVSYLVDFDQSVQGVNDGIFQGSGFTQNNSSGSLDAAAWSISGMTDGNKPFGIEKTTGDYARGNSTGGESTGGFYAFEVAPGNNAFGFQPTSGDFTPGTITLKIHNNSSTTVQSLDINYSLYCLNDKDYASSMNFSISYDNTTFYNVSSGAYSTPELADNISWTQESKSIILSGLLINPSSDFYIRWASSDLSGSGGRDEIAIDDILIELNNTFEECEEPTAQASNLVFSTITSNSIQGSFQLASADKYLVLESETPNLTALPIDGISYSAGQTLGNARVIQFNGDSYFHSTGLTEQSLYYYTIFTANDDCSGGPDYYLANPEQNSINTLVSTTGDYYDGMSGLTCENLKTALYNLVKDHSMQSYGSLWTHYEVTDDRLNDAGQEVIVRDVYSDNPTGSELEFSFGTEQCGTYQSEGECYNREHTFPKSWWGGATNEPQYTDLFTVVPTDGWVNGLRNNNPYGEVQSGTETHETNNGSKMGASSITIPSYSGSVFEPIDEYKGDLARGYFYMAVRYENVIAGWKNNTVESSVVLSGDAFTVFEPWMLDMLIAWHNSDPVDQFEIERNEAIYGIQGNRNPFIDHPEYVDLIWDACSTNNCSIVTNALNDGEGSLRNAIECAEENAIVSFSPAMNNGIVEFTFDSLVIDKNITIEATPGSNIYIQASASVQSINFMFKIKNGAQVTLKGFTIEGAYGLNGSAIFNEGTLILDNMTFVMPQGVVTESLIYNSQGSSLIFQGVNELQ